MKYQYQDQVTGEVFEVRQSPQDPAYTHRHIDQPATKYYCVYAFDHREESRDGYHAVRRIG